MNKVLVIGGNGFLGRHLVQALYQRGLSVRIFDLKTPSTRLVESVVGDIRDAEAVAQACDGCDTVFNTAALIDWGPRSRQRLIDINIQGNRNVIQACYQAGVKRLVYTSSIDVVFDGSPIAGQDESLPYPDKHLDDYGWTKSVAERETLAANGQQGLLTCALRTAGIYGPGDTTRFPQILQSVKNGQWIHLGDGSARFGHVYVANAAAAHVLAAESLVDGSPVAGQCYFIGDHAPSNFYTFFDPFLAALGFPPTTRRLSFRMAYGLAAVSERLAKWGVGPSRPRLTRYTVASTCVDFFFSHAKAKRDFGYEPVVPAETAFTETCAWLRNAGYVK